MDNLTLLDNLKRYIQQGEKGDISILSSALDYGLTQENALMLIMESLKGNQAIRHAIDDLLTDINYHSFNRALTALTAAYDDIGGDDE